MTKVRLDFCISPGLELLPSKMVYIKDSPGYNNILLISSVNQKFGTNTNVNSVMKRVVNSPVKSASNSPVKSNAAKLGENIAGSNNTQIITASLFLVVLGRLAWIAFL